METAPQSRCTHKHCIRMHKCGATILITEAVSPPRLPLGTTSSMLALQRKRYLIREVLTQLYEDALGELVICYKSSNYIQSHKMKDVE